ncbi:MAG TPA: hypothetical protein VMT62_00795 [Syntrophorhabdaceae bacterium]|nr:hypothetical protein [Syntrophorhabdaceae bacterium]
MFKTVTISFRTKQELLDWLDHVSQESKCSRSALIEAILRKSIDEGFQGDTMFNRIVEERGSAAAEERSLSSEDVSYVTVGGVKIGLPKNISCNISFDQDKSTFSLDLTPVDGNVTEASKREPGGQLIEAGNLKENAIKEVL